MSLKGTAYEKVWMFYILSYIGLGTLLELNVER